jgi:hypothetical protein
MAITGVLSGSHGVKSNIRAHFVSFSPWCALSAMLFVPHDTSGTIVLCDLSLCISGVLPASLPPLNPVSSPPPSALALRLPPLHPHPLIPSTTSLSPPPCHGSVESPRGVLVKTTPSLELTGSPPHKERSSLTSPVLATHPRALSWLCFSLMRSARSNWRRPPPRRTFPRLHLHLCFIVRAMLKRRCHPWASISLWLPTS